jgi:V/A-type H+-transporting ATPase subunit E
MALEHILKAMDAEAQAEIDRLLAEAETRERDIVAAAEAEVPTIQARHHAEILPAVQVEVARLQYEARLTALREVMHAREELIERAFDLAEAQLGEVRQRPDYPVILHRLTAEVLTELGPSIVLRVDRRDLSLMRAILAELGVQATLEEGLNTPGGLEGSTADGQIYVYNTLTSRLARARQSLRREVAALLAGEGTAREVESEAWLANTTTAALASER